MNYLILLRHGQSKWNLENKFTGLTDVDLTEAGIKEAINAGKLLKKLSINIDKIYSSELKRANDTAKITMKEVDLSNLYKKNELIMTRDQALNERDYGNLVGLNKADTIKKYGKEQVHIWRRSFDIPPPGGESLKDVLQRVEIYFNATIKKDIKANKNILVVAHGNSLRAMLICLKIYKPENISKVEIPTGKPILIEFENNNLLSHKTLDS
tara:strand:+ start:201 stop:833 length:633 start_codon:yes stop_codon:yes gene_type:complete